jgi:serine protease Do
MKLAAVTTMFGLLFGSLFAPALAPTTAGPACPVHEYRCQARTTADVVADVLPAIVEFQEDRASRPDDEGDTFDNEMRSLWWTAPKAMRTIGTGFYIAADKILTASHVVEGAKTAHLRNKSGKTFEGTVVANDRGRDLALVKVEVTSTVYLKFARYATVGEDALMFGHPHGLTYSVTRGIVSALHRKISYSGYHVSKMLQTDASGNPGNSGGPVTDAQGKVIGVLTAGDFGAQGLLFAVELSLIHEFLTPPLER